MASIKPLIRKNKVNQLGEAPLAIRVTYNRKSTFVFIGHRLDPKFWDEGKSRVKKSHPNSVRLNNLIAKKISEVDTYLLDQESKKMPVDFKVLKTKISQKPNKDNGFKVVSQDYLSELEKLEQYTRLGPDRSRIEHFEEFVNGDILFEHINVALLEKFKIFLKTTYDHSDRTVFNHLVLIRTLFNRAIKHDLVDATFYPFGTKGITMKRPQSEKIGLEAKEVKLFESYKCEKGSSAFHARNVFLVSFYLAGARVSDVLSLKWEDIKGDRLYYRMQKNKKVGSIKLAVKLVAILKTYKNMRKPEDTYVFPDLNKADVTDKKDVRRKIGTATKTYNKWLQRIADELGINKKISCHIARHSFGNISGDRIPIQMLQKLYRHSDIQTTISYQASFINKDTDDALDKVLDI